MNEQLQTEIANALRKMVEATETASGLLAEELPDVIQQFLVLKIAENLAHFVAGIFLLGVFCAGAYYGHKWVLKREKEHSRKGDELWDGTPTIVFAMCMLPFSIGGICLINLQWFYIWLAPKAWLIEYVAMLK